jgi:outer membrane receptor protein involved in Fe transport
LALLPVFAAVPALAQSAPQTETIEVTGTRLKNTDAQSANPITVVSSEDIAKTEATTVEQVLRKLPSADFTGGVTANSNNGGDGASQISLHNLGPARTLVLVNGQRYVGTDIQGTTTPVDLNNIPVSMIDHIEILRDGASSIYGADAIAGVINIITKQHFNGVQLDTSIGMTSAGDGLTYSTAVTAGADFDRGNILLNGSHDHRDAIAQADRSWATNQFVGTSGEGNGPISSKLPVLTGSFITSVSPTGATTSSGTRYFNNANGSSVGISSPSLIGTPGLVNVGGREFFDLSQQPHLIGSLDRNQLNFTTHYDLAPNITAIMEGFYTDRRSEQILNPDPLSSTISTTKYPGLLIPACIGEPAAGVAAANLNPNGTVNCTALGLATNTQNPLNRDITGANYRPFGGGDRVYRDELQTYRARIGLEGTVFSSFDWQVGYVYGQSSATYQVANEANFSHLAQLTGQTACGVDVNQGCSVANFFGVNPLTPAQVKYLEFTDTRTSQVQEDYVYANIGGPIYQLPAGPLQASLGFEQRNESGYDHPDSVIVNGDGDANAAPSSGSYSVTSAYGELNIPIIKDIPFVKALTADVSSRYDLYTSFGRALTWKAGLNYQVNDDLRFRGSESTGFRAPQVKELFGGTFQNFLTFSGDPCDTGNGGGTFQGSATCVASLKKAGVANPGTYVSQLDQVANPQVPTLSGGNPHLKPETSQQFSLGTVLTPHWVQNLAVTVDYYNIHVRNAITTFDPGTIINQCYGAQQLQSACSAITRSASGDISAVVSNEVNFGYENTDGIEVGVTYAMDTGMIGLPDLGALKWDGQASYLMHDTTLNADGTIRQNAGTYDIATGAGEPRYKALLGLSFLRNNWSVDWTTRYYGGVKNVDGTTFNTTNPNGTPCTKGCGDFLGNEAAGVFYHDISGTYRYKNVTLTVGVDNLFDKNPPVIFGDVSSANSLSAAGYDFTGRFIYTKMSVKF